MSRAVPVTRLSFGVCTVNVTTICLEAGVSRASYYRSPVAAMVKEVMAAPTLEWPEAETLKAEIVRLKRDDRELRSAKAQEIRELAETKNTYANHIQVLTLRNAQLEEENQRLRQRLESQEGVIKIDRR
jgi:hypothetical protein